MGGFFALRNYLRWTGLRAREKPEAFAPVTPRGRELWARYQLDWCGRFSERTSREALGFLDLLDRFGEGMDLSPPLVLDVGSKSWRYAPALGAWLDARFPDVKVNVFGVELDAFRLFADLTTGISRGRMMAGLVSGGALNFEYIPGDVRAFKTGVGCVTWFFPFLHCDTHRSWGLPAHLFAAEDAFIHVASLLNSGGCLLMANQGEWEGDQAKKILESFHKCPTRPRLRLERMELVEGSLHPCAYPIVLTRWIREA